MLIIIIVIICVTISTNSIVTVIIRMISIRGDWSSEPLGGDRGRCKGGRGRRGLEDGLFLLLSLLCLLLFCAEALKMFVVLKCYIYIYIYMYTYIYIYIERERYRERETEGWIDR